MSDIRQPERSETQREHARDRARRTARLFAGIAFAVYVGFLLIVATGK